MENNIEGYEVVEKSDSISKDVTLEVTEATSIKEVYLIRHAESIENTRIESAQRSWDQIRKLKAPTKDDLKSSVKVLKFQENADSLVSDKGKSQINQLHEGWWKQRKVDKGYLVVHSPLVRAKETCLGMIGDHNKEFCERLLEKTFLREKTPKEFLPGNNSSLLKRIDEFQTWLVQQPERVVFVVGHSQYFRTMLKLKYNFTNCSVWRVNFDTSSKTWQDLPINEFQCSVDTNIDHPKETKA